jgi:predicted DsbA family dithiol-disulfide isomerase
MRIDIWSDIVCPWCYIGKRRFERALAEFPHPEAIGPGDIVHRSFQLNPSLPTDKTPARRAALMAKYGLTEAQAREMDATMERTAAGEGLEFHLEGGLTGNTFDAHQLVHLAGVRGLQDEVIERLYRAYFTEQRSIFDEDSLVDLGSEAGLDAAESRAALRSRRYAQLVREDIELARTIGISGVPFFVIDGQYGISGAQPSEIFAAALEKAWRGQAVLGQSRT